MFELAKFQSASKTDRKDWVTEKLQEEGGGKECQGRGRRQCCRMIKRERWRKRRKRNKEEGEMGTKREVNGEEKKKEKKEERRKLTG